MDLSLKYIGSWIGGSFNDIEEKNEILDNKEESQEQIPLDDNVILKGIHAFSPDAQDLIRDSFEDIEGMTMDYHTHIAGIGSNGTGCMVHSSMHSPYLHPFKRLKFQIFMSASGVNSEEDGDQQYVKRLVQLIRHCRLVSNGKWGKHVILPLDHWHDQDGTERKDITGLYCPNEYVLRLSQEYPDCFIPACSIHPYRPNAVELLQQSYDNGCRLCKWLPNSMGIDPSDDRCDIFYDKLRSLGMVLLSHVGEEHSVEGGAINQYFGNPLLLRRPLSKGVTVIAAHCASEGRGLDLDLLRLPSGSQESDQTLPTPPIPTTRTAKEGIGNRVYKDNYELLMRMMKEENTKDRLFADISAMTSIKRCGAPLIGVIDQPEIHHRLLPGSDYPVPCISLVVQTKLLYMRGYITYAQIAPLNEIYSYNPLLFDYVVKRTIRSPVTGKILPPTLFQPNPHIVVESIPQTTHNIINK